MLLITTVKYSIRLIFHGDFISQKQEKVGFTNFSRFLVSRMDVWASFPDVLSLILAGI